MANLILVTGGTGTVGRVVVQHLLDAGRQVRVLSRGRRRPGPAQHVTGDVRTGEGLDEAIAGVDAIVHCVDPVHRVVEAALRAGKPHLVYISIVGVDRVPFGYYRRKLADERLIGDSGLPWTVLRTTQFHDLVAVLLRLLAKPPVMMVPAGWSFQPVDVREVGEGLARTYLAAVRKRRPILPVPLPGSVCRAYRAGGHLAPQRAVGTIPFAQYLGEQLAAGTLPYDDAIRDYTRRPPRKHAR